MKFHFKTFAMSLIFTGILLGIAAGSYWVYYTMSMNEAKNDKVIVANYEKHTDDASKTPLERLIDQSERVNFLVYGTDGERSDTLMLVSYDVKTKMTDVVSIPRDTYVDYDSKKPAWQKINSVIERKEGGGPQGLKETVSKLLKVPISYYIEVRYSGIKNIVDAVGGVEVNVPVNMNYDDNYCKPPLHIHLNAGLQTLNGDKAVQFLRWRKNTGQEGAGDLPRTKRQQEFIHALVEKSFSLKLPAVIQSAYSAVETDMDLNKMLFFGTTTTGFNMDEIRTHRLPGENKASKYFYYSSDIGIEKLMIKIYSRTPGQINDADSDIVNKNGIVLDSVSNGALTPHLYEPASDKFATKTTSDSSKNKRSLTKKRVKTRSKIKEASSTTVPENSESTVPSDLGTGTSSSDTEKDTEPGASSN